MSKLLCSVAAAACLMSLQPASYAQQGPSQKIMLVFSVEQAFVNSPLENEDTVGLERVANTLNALKPRYEVFVSLGCAQTDQQKLRTALDVFATHHIRFLLDTWASDTLGPPRPADTPVTSPFDKSHGLCRSIAELQALHDAYPGEFAGVRLHEVFAANLSVVMFHNGEDWFPQTSPFYPKDDFFQQKFLEQQFRFAAHNGMFVLFSDPWWFGEGTHSIAAPIVHQQLNEAVLAGVMKRYPGIGMLMYANNEPLKSGPDPLHERMTTWRTVLPDQALTYSLRFGLSDQAWLCDRIHTPETACDPHLLGEWASAAIAQGATILEFEPYWFFFNFPRTAGDTNNDRAYSKYAQRGFPTHNFSVLVDGLNKAIGGDTK